MDNISNFEQKQKNKWVAILLCVFLGTFGAHKFYEGKIGMGILYLLTFGIFYIGAIIDFIILLTKPTTYYVAKKNKSQISETSTTITNSNNFAVDSVVIPSDNTNSETSRFDFEFPDTNEYGHAILKIYDMNVVGVMHHQDGIDPQRIIPSLYENEQMILEADPNNIYDKNAVKVKTMDGVQVGWLPKGENLQIDIANRLNNGQTVYSRVKKGYLLNNYPGKVGLVIDVARYSKN